MPIRFASSMILLVTVLAGCGDLDHSGTGPADPAAPTATGAQQGDAAAPSSLDAAVAQDSSSPVSDGGTSPTQDAAPPQPPHPPPPPPPDPGEANQHSPKMD